MIRTAPDDPPPRRDAGAGVAGMPAPARIVVLWWTGAFAILASTVAIWLLRIDYDGYVYVSGLGATGQATANAFNLALLGLGLGGVALAAVVRLRQPLPAPRSAHLIWASLLCSGACFVVASRVPCSAGCPVPGTAEFTLSDAVHLTAAIIGFVLACLAMLCVAVSPGPRSARRIAIASCAVVGGLSAAGGLLALVSPEAGVGAWFEFAAMTAAVCWLVLYAAGSIFTGSIFTGRIFAGSIFAGRSDGRGAALAPLGHGSAETTHQQEDHDDQQEEREHRDDHGEHRQE